MEHAQPGAPVRTTCIPKWPNTWTTWFLADVLVFVEKPRYRPLVAPTIRCMTPSYGGLALEIVVPVFNEEAVLENSISRLAEYLTNEMPSTWKITIADNASTDRTPVIAARLSEQLPTEQFRRLDVKGRGDALRAAWGA